MTPCFGSGFARCIRPRLNQNFSKVLALQQLDEIRVELHQSRSYIVVDSVHSWLKEWLIVVGRSEMKLMPGDVNLIAGDDKTQQHDTGSYDNDRSSEQ